MSKMKDLSKFETVKKALEQVVSESDINNGTQGIELMAHFWQQENTFDQKRQDLQVAIAQSILNGELTKVKDYQKEMDKLPKPKILMEWKLLTPMPRIQGTKTISDGEKLFKISMDNVQSLFIHEDAVHLGLLEYEETNDVMRDALGRDAMVVKLHLKKGIIDVAAPYQDKFGRQIRPKRAMVTAISYRAMQIANEVMSKERTAKRRRYGFDEQQ